MQRLCDRALLIEGGHVTAEGPPSTVVADYVRRVGADQQGGRAVVPDGADRFGTGEVRIREVALTAIDGTEFTDLRLGQPAQVHITMDAAEAIPEAVFEVGICNAEGERVATAQSIDREQPTARLGEGRHTAVAALELTLLPGEYALDVGVHRRNGRTIDYLERVLDLSGLNVAEQGDDHYPWPSVRGYIRPVSSWTLSSAGEAVATSRCRRA